MLFTRRREFAERAPNRNGDQFKTESKSLKRECLIGKLFGHGADGAAFLSQLVLTESALDDPRDTALSCAQRLERERVLIGQTASFDYSYLFSQRIILTVFCFSYHSFTFSDLNLRLLEMSLPNGRYFPKTRPNAIFSTILKKIDS